MGGGMDSCSRREASGSVELGSSFSDGGSGKK